jgi:hypothetical protein
VIGRTDQLPTRLSTHARGFPTPALEWMLFGETTKSVIGPIGTYLAYFKTAARAPLKVMLDRKSFPLQKSNWRCTIALGSLIRTKTVIG